MFIYGINGRRTWVEAPDKGDGDGDEDTPADKVLAGIQNLLKRHGGDSEAAVRVLYQDNYTLRDEVRQLKAKQPAEGATILTGDDATAWAAYQALGKPADLKTAVDERTQLQGKLAGMERDTALRSVAEAAGYKPTVLSNLDRMAQAQGKTLTYDVREQTVDGKPVRVAYVKDGDKELPIADYATTNWADFLPSLATAQGSGEQQSGTRFVSQHAGSGAQKPATTKDVADSYISKTYKRS